jgi:hypothetical protein
MKFQKHDKKTLDLIGKRLLARDVVPTAEIERIVSDPRLFTKIRARKTQPALSTFDFLIGYPALVGGIAIFVIAALAGVTLVRRDQNVPYIPQVRSPADVSAAVRPANLPPLMVGSNPSPGRTNSYREAEPERPAPRTAAYTAPKPKRSAEPRDGRPQFYPLNYSGDTSELSAGSHIVRVDIPRSSLFAMGVDVPLENDSETVKADLLVGADGVTRAIRVLK